MHSGDAFAWPSNCVLIKGQPFNDDGWTSHREPCCAGQQGGAGAQQLREAQGQWRRRRCSLGLELGALLAPLQSPEDVRTCPLTLQLPAEVVGVVCWL